MINLDMIGRMKNSNLYISGTGTSPIFSSMLDSVALNHNLILNKNPDGFGPSDHASFYVNDIPVLFSLLAPILIIIDQATIGKKLMPGV